MAMLKTRKRGTAVVEAVIVLPLLLLLTLGMIEYGWLFMRMHQIQNVARQAARYAVTPDATTAAAQGVISTTMSNLGISASAYSYTFTPANVASLTPGQTLTVQIQATSNNLGIAGSSIIPMPTNVYASITMSKEGP